MTVDEISHDVATVYDRSFTEARPKADTDAVTLYLRGASFPLMSNCIGRACVRDRVELLCEVHIGIVSFIATVLAGYALFAVFFIE